MLSAKEEVLYQGKNTWDGQRNIKNKGEYQKVYPIFSPSRIKAGITWFGDMLNTIKSLLT